MSKLKKIYYIIFFVISLCMCSPATIYASDVSPEEITDKADDMKLSDGAKGVTTDADGTNGISIQYNNDSGSISTPVRMLLVLTVLTLAPSILILMTSYTRIIIVLHFVRTAIGTQSTPPNQVLVGLALFLTGFIMWPTFQQINTEAIKPLDEGKINTEQFIEKAEEPLREFMYGQTQTKDLALFVSMSDEKYESNNIFYAVIKVQFHHFVNEEYFKVIAID